MPRAKAASPQNAPVLRPLGAIVLFLPFWAGGFSPLSCAVTSAFLFGYLYWLFQRNQEFRLRLSDTLLALTALTVFGGLGLFWGADRGMAVFGFLRFLPVLLFALALGQFEPTQRQLIFDPVPLCGGVMTILSFCMKQIPGLAEYVTVDGRLAGFFQYPNAFAAFAIAGLVISATNSKRSRWHTPTEALLVFGVFQSGSRTGFAVMIVILVFLLLHKREKHFVCTISVTVAGCFLLALLPGVLGQETTADRFLTISGESSSLLGRLLYYRDAIPLIFSHPLGLGYLGWQAVQGSIQTGVYDVAHVHSWLLQLLLDVGWLPAILFCWAVIRSFFSREATARSRLLLLTILGHSMLDFDLEFLSLWLLLVGALDLGQEKPIRVKKAAVPGVLLGCLVLLGLWLGLGDGLFRAGRADLCLSVTPFHTHALEYRLTQQNRADAVEETAQAILDRKPTSSIAHSAQANVCFAKGDIDGMIRAKQQAIACARYSMAEYCDYFDKLYAAYQKYQELGDPGSADVCLHYLQEIPEMLRTLEAQTSPLALRLSEKPEFQLPAYYRTLLAQAAGSG